MRGVALSSESSKWQQPLQKASIFFTLEHSLTVFLQTANSLVAKTACTGNSVQPVPSDSAFSPFAYMSFAKQKNNLGIWSLMTALDVIQMSFESRSDQ